MWPSVLLNLALEGRECKCHLSVVIVECSVELGPLLEFRTLEECIDK